MVEVGIEEDSERDDIRPVVDAPRQARWRRRDQRRELGACKATSGRKDIKPVPNAGCVGPPTEIDRLDINNTVEESGAGVTFQVLRTRTVRFRRYMNVKDAARVLVIVAAGDGQRIGRPVIPRSGNVAMIVDVPSATHDNGALSLFQSACRHRSGIRQFRRGFRHRATISCRPDRLSACSPRRHDHYPRRGSQNRPPKISRRHKVSWSCPKPRRFGRRQLPSRAGDRADSAVGIFDPAAIADPHLAKAANANLQVARVGPPG